MRGVLSIGAVLMVVALFVLRDSAEPENTLAAMEARTLGHLVATDIVVEIIVHANIYRAAVSRVVGVQR